MSVRSAAGNGDIKLGYIVLDETGNLSVDRATFNDYKGASLSLENFRYDFKQRHATPRQSAEYDSEQSQLDRGHRQGGTVFAEALAQSVPPYLRLSMAAALQSDTMKVLRCRFIRSGIIELFGGGTSMGRTGSTTDLFSPGPIPDRVEVDYKQTFYNGGARITYRGMMVAGRISRQSVP